MTKMTEWMVRVAAGVVMLWFGWNLAAGTVVQMVNLNLQNRALTEALKKQAGQQESHAPTQ